MEKMIYGQIEGKVNSITYHGKGSLSNRYIISIDGDSYFAKTFRPGEDCYGRGSREIIKNEIAVQGFFDAHPDAGILKDNLGYRGYTEINDVTLVLFKDNVSWSSGATLADKIGIESDKLLVGINLPTDAEILAEKKSIRATKYEVYDVPQVVDIIRQIAEQMNIAHNLAPSNYRGEERRGVIHMDGTPNNIMIAKESGTSRRLKASLMDYGISRERDAPVDQLFNKAVVTDVNVNGYYAAQGGIFNLTYSPVGGYKGDNIRATPSMDIYFLRNVMCLMLTGRLPEYWDDIKDITVGIVTGNKEKSTDGSLEDLFGDLFNDEPNADEFKLDDKEKKKSWDFERPFDVKNKLYSKLLSEIIGRYLKIENDEDGDKIEMATSLLARMIVYGKCSLDGGFREYESCTELIADLDSLELKVQSQDISIIPPPCEIPPFFAGYSLPLPEQLETVFKPCFDEMVWSVLKLKPVHCKTQINDYSSLESVIRASIKKEQDSKELKECEDDLRVRSPLKNGLKKAAIGATVLGGLFILGSGISWSVLKYDLTNEQNQHVSASPIQDSPPYVGPVTSQGIFKKSISVDASQMGYFDDLFPLFPVTNPVTPVKAPGSLKGKTLIAENHPSQKDKSSAAKNPQDQNVIIRSGCGTYPVNPKFNLPPSWKQYRCEVPPLKSDAHECIIGANYIPEPRDAQNNYRYSTGSDTVFILTPCTDGKLCCPQDVKKVSK